MFQTTKVIFNDTYSGNFRGVSEVFRNPLSSDYNKRIVFYYPEGIREARAGHSASVFADIH